MSSEFLNKKLTKDSVVRVIAPFEYTIGELGPHTGKLLTCVADCIEEAKQEIFYGITDACVVFDNLENSNL